VVKDKDEGQLTTDTYEQRTKDHGPRTTDQGLRTEDQLQLFARGQPLQDAIVQGRVINLKEVHLLRRGGARRPVGLTAMPLSDASGALSGAVGVLTDITELRALQHERYRLTPLAVIGEMSARLAHEIKNPLSSMMSGLELLKRRTHYGEREGQYFDRLIAELQRLDTTVREMLAYSREPPPVLSPVDPAEPLQCALDTLMPQLEAALISVNRDVQWGLPATLMDANQMEQVFLNLIVNAIQAMPDGGTLTATVSLVPGPSSSVLGPLSLAQDQGSGIRDQGSGIRDQGSGNESLTPDPCSLTPVIEYTISDTGVGVPPEVIDKIFDPFFSTKTHGTGLGLASAQRTVEAHQGQISLESRPGPGATFIIRLPHRRE
jgi:signal transduction histidine kinase